MWPQSSPLWNVIFVVFGTDAPPCFIFQEDVLLMNDWLHDLSQAGYEFPLLTTIRQ